MKHHPRQVPFCPFYFRVPLLKPTSRKKGTLIMKGLLRNLDLDSLKKNWCDRKVDLHKLLSAAQPVCPAV